MVRARFRVWLCLVVAAAVGGALAGCGGDEAPAAAPTGGGSVPTASPTAASAAAEQEALAAYRSLREAQVRAEAAGRIEGSGLDRYADGQALADLYNSVLSNKRNGIVVRGQPRLRPEVSAVDLEASPPTATIRDCFDISGWEPVYEDSGESAAAPGQPTRFVVTARAEAREAGWVVTAIEADRGRSC